MCQRISKSWVRRLPACRVCGRDLAGTGVEVSTLEACVPRSSPADHLNLKPSPRLDDTSGRLPVYGQFQKAGAPEVSKEFVARRLGVVRQNPFCRVLSDAHAGSQLYPLVRQLFSRDVCNDVAKAIDVNDAAPNLPAGDNGRRRRVEA